MKLAVALFLLALASPSYAADAPKPDAEHVTVTLSSTDWKWVVDCTNTGICYPATQVARINQAIITQANAQLNPPKAEKK